MQLSVSRPISQLVGTDLKTLTIYQQLQFYTCFDWFKKLRLFVNEQNLRIDIVLKTSRAVVIMCFSLNEAPLGLFIFISDYKMTCDSKINLFPIGPNRQKYNYVFKSSSEWMLTFQVLFNYQMLHLQRNPRPKNRWTTIHVLIILL
jgi:hypothetical protein